MVSFLTNKLKKLDGWKQVTISLVSCHYLRFSLIRSFPHLWRYINEELIKYPPLWIISYVFWVACVSKFVTCAGHEDKTHWNQWNQRTSLCGSSHCEIFFCLFSVWYLVGVYISLPVGPFIREGISPNPWQLLECYKDLGYLGVLHEN